MKIALIRLGAAALSLAFAWPTQGAYTGLHLQYVGVVNMRAGPKKVYRIYAHFSEGSDRVVGWGGSPFPPLSSTVLHTIHCTSPTLQLGAPFFNHKFGGNTAPRQVFINTFPEIQWDTFVTIGVSIADQGSGPPEAPDQTQLSGNFSTLNSNEFTLTNGGVGAWSMPAQARADYAGDGDPQLRVLLGQFTVDVNDGFDGRIGILVTSDEEGTLHTHTNQMFQIFYGWSACCLPAGVGCFYYDLCGLFGGTVMCECEDCPHTCFGDIVVNGVVDVNDLEAVILNWGPCPNCPFFHCPPDIAPSGVPPGDCQMNVNDLLMVITNWGPCP